MVKVTNARTGVAVFDRERERKRGRKRENEREREREKERKRERERESERGASERAVFFAICNCER